jgi:hypothetical protein
MKYILFLFSTLTFTSFSQDYQTLTAEERAYFFHTVRKSPILENNLGRFLQYTGPDIFLSNGSIHYDSIEELIINQPDLLIIRNDEIRKSAKGLLAEASNKMALFELNKALLAHTNNDVDMESDRLKYDDFEYLIIRLMPYNAFKSRNDVRSLHPKIDNVFNPSLSLSDKISMLESFRFLDLNDRLEVLKAINYATNTYIEKRSFEIFQSLGGEAEIFENILVAAGDGSNTSGMLEEREKDERGRWNKGLPKAVGLFPYQVSIVEKTNEKKKKSKTIQPATVAKYEVLSAGNNRETNLHFDVWGYNSKKQTTVVIEKDGRAYRLFGSGETRFLSPDSNFAEGATYQSIINNLEFDKIKKLDEKIYGRKGFDYWIEYNNKKKEETELKIEKIEKKYSDLGYNTTSTNKRPSRKVRKERKKSKALKDYQPTTNSQKKERAKTQIDIVSLYGLFNGYKKQIKELEMEKADALGILASYQLRLEQYKRNFGLFPMPFTVKKGMYTFADSTTFDMYTQEFVFIATLDTSLIDIRLIAIPDNSLSEKADEVMLHINRMDAKTGYDARIQLELLDVFESDAYRLTTPLFEQKDSIALRLLFEGLLNKKVDFEVVARGEGIGVATEYGVKKEPISNELETYPGDTPEEKAISKASTDFRLLRRSDVIINLNRVVRLEVNSYTDPVKSNVKVAEPELLEQFEKLELSKNEQLSAMRTFAILTKLKDELNVLAGLYMTRPEAKIIIDRLNKELAKSKINIGRYAVKAKI